MRCVGVAVLAAVLGLTNAASAGSNVVVMKENYTITGKTGEELLAAMKRTGPKKGYMVHAMAQTRYSLRWNTKWDKSGGGCRVANPGATLYITYRYPWVKGGMSPDLQKRWAKFMDSVRTHEETHGRIAREMVDAAEKAVAGIANDNDPDCSKSNLERLRRVRGVESTYEGKQRQFDAKEHHYGGNVDGMLALLTAKQK
ncbi:DUF922 domain-containing protein [Mesorhizobium sp. YR577]|jgi:predicted secreted Zn-dependent protease|uniref:DUF922 domain-containing protein n=1 Tax=Mesorhizobium sp. YR577 TaxID=1884373 RepID=UPI0008E108F0|nr:DUF922 domain-containing protein [Mesorhizobium sp. YR577]SFT97002.1 Predicted secreted Zn-dependent protease [Mesorhizobium sp. YR577]